MSGIRKSGRQRPRKKYTVDAFAGLDINLLNSSEDELLAEPPEDLSNDQEYGENVEEGAGTADEDLSMDEGSGADASAADDAGEYGSELDEDESGVEFGEPRVSIPRGQKRLLIPGQPHRTKPSEDPASNFHIRGLPEGHHHAAKEIRAANTFGPAPEDIMPAIKARIKWGAQATLPSRTEDNAGIGGMSHSLYYDDETRELQATEGWTWYRDEGGKAAFDSRQSTQVLSAGDAIPYLPKFRSDSQSFLMGPFANQGCFTLETGSSMHLTDAWPQSNHGRPRIRPKEGRDGWIVNVGTRIHCLDWVPNQAGTTQYLAVSTLPTSGQASGGFPSTSSTGSDAPAFTPSAPTPGSIQIWAFGTGSTSEGDVSLSAERHPRLRLVICTDWGDPKQFKWCPLPYKDIPHEATSETGVRLGLLAGIWGDGKIRVLDVRCPNSATDSTQHIHISAAAFEVRAPGTVFTCLTWLSTKSITAGCANGFVALFDISKTLTTHPPSTSLIPRPSLYQCFHQAYILSLVSAHPSRPYFLATSSMDGYLRLTDLRAPNLDYVYSQRNRVGSLPIAWHEVSQSVLVADELYKVQCVLLRRFYTNVAVARFSAQALSIATSPVHPFALVACADGTVTATNPFRRAIDNKVTVFQQKWFGHEWRRGIKADERADSQTAPRDATTTPQQNGDQASEDVMEVDQSPQPTPVPVLDRHHPPEDSHNVTVFQSAQLAQPVSSLANAQVPKSALENPLVRITDGFKIEQPGLIQSDNQSHNVANGSVYSTIFEEETAVTQVCWNPNLHCGGWAAAGMGSGLLRVEDLAL
ncbi:hypothetical protein W97_07024 [Coniosporium apollinis CBS 100218]|uniref:Uncharacterized protein n=1 Tax=Coniosporium apollinis (strain CBS 100218) TaxID=1168221 RepID=R7Z153_CONA1|nr:uncharacterized protein W97_07024 [Coniosporium apollinis CBS 100218]EON67769.1 hypothetical protein W97_07024 [Coniosporium apollinis CBS 100218]